MVLVFHQAALGDAVLLWPTLRGLAGSGLASGLASGLGSGGERIVLVSRWDHAVLTAEVLGAQGVDIGAMDIEMFEFTRLHAAGGPTRVSPAVGALFEQATRVVGFMGRDDGVWLANVTRLAAGAMTALVPPRPAKDWAGHVTQWHRAALAEQGMTWEGVDAADAVETFELVEPVNTLSGEAGTVVLHPGSGGAAKCWPEPRYRELAGRLTARGHQVVVVLGEVERERWSAEVVSAWESEHEVVWPRGAMGLVEVVRGAGVYVGNDSGPTHVAAGVGVATIALFGPTRPAVWRPMGRSVEVLSPPTEQDMSWLEVEAVLAAVDRASARA